MPTQPAQRLDRLLRHVREAWALCCSEPAFRARSVEWLREHPSPAPELDALWLDALQGAGPLAAWLDAGSDPDTWAHPDIPLHSVLTSHPFPHLAAWSIRRTFRAS